MGIIKEIYDGAMAAGTKHVLPDVVCPYYKKSDNIRIVCEGITEASSVHIVFGGKEGTTRYIKTYCATFSGCRKCRLHKLLDAKYGIEK